MPRYMMMTFNCPKCEHPNRNVEFGVDVNTGTFVFLVDCQNEECGVQYNVPATADQVIQQAKKAVKSTPRAPMGLIPKYIQ